MHHIVLPSITTAGAAKATWRQAINDRTLLGIPEIALFLTGLNKQERVELYAILEIEALASPLRIPFVHARSDMEAEEYDYLIKQFGTERFNLHPTKDFPLAQKLPPRLKKRIYIENLTGLSDSDVRGFAGVCTDISHMEDVKLQGMVEELSSVMAVVNRFGAGVSHISPVKKVPYQFKNGSISYAPHKADCLQNFDYIKAYPPLYIGKYVAIEVENSLAEQMHIKLYLETIIAKKYARKRLIASPLQLPAFTIAS